MTNSTSLITVRWIWQICFWVALCVYGSGVANAAPSTPTGATPGSTSSPGPTLSSSTVTLKWKKVSKAKRYELRIRDLSKESDRKQETSATSYNVTVSAGRQYRWRVRACDSRGCSEFTEWLYFQTKSKTQTPAPDTVKDDHGNACDTATTVNINTSKQGSIGSAVDWDYFKIKISSPGALAIYTTGSTDTRGSLRKADCGEITSNDDIDLANKNFRINRVLDGTSYIGVGHSNGKDTGKYELNIKSVLAGTTNQTGKWEYKSPVKTEKPISNLWGYFNSGMSQNATSNYVPIDSMVVSINGKTMTLRAFPNAYQDDNDAGKYNHDGVFQCTALVSEYLSMLGFANAPKSLPNGKDVVTSLAAGANKEYFTSIDNKVPPVAGSIISMNAGTQGKLDGIGHVAIVKSIEKIGESTLAVKLIEQNIAKKDTKEFSINREIIFTRGSDGFWSASHKFDPTSQYTYPVLNWTTPVASP